MYRPQSSDTSERVDRMLIEGYRRMSPAEKIARIRALSETAYLFAAAGEKRSDPAASDGEVRLRVAARRLDDELVKRVTRRYPEITRR